MIRIDNASKISTIVPFVVRVNQNIDINCVYLKKKNSQSPVDT